MNEMAIAPHQRGIEDVTRDIRIKTGQFLMDAIDIGRLLFEAKAMVEPGKWMEYVEQELPFSQSWANNYMRLYKEFGGEQLSLFSNSQSLANLRPTQALALLTLNEEERQEFLETHDVENMSTRELQQAIRERDEERAARESAEAELEKVQSTVEDLRDSAKAAQEKALQLKEDLTKAQEVAADAAKKATEELQKELDAANTAQTEAVKAREEAEQKLAAAQKALQLANPATAVFRVIFEQVQKDFDRMNDALSEVQQADPEIAKKLRSAVAALLQKLKDDLGE